MRSCLGTDGEAFSCTLYFHGRRLGVVTQGGHGGPNSYSLPWREMKEGVSPDAHRWLRANEGWWTEFLGESDTQENVDAFIGVLLDAKDSEKRCKTLLRKKVVVRLPDGAMYEWVKTKHPEWDKKCREHIATKYPEGVILNDLPIEEAVGHLFVSEGA